MVGERKTFRFMYLTFGYVRLRARVLPKLGACDVPGTVNIEVTPCVVGCPLCRL
jgi:hypothetical protein